MVATISVQVDSSVDRVDRVDRVDSSVGKFLIVSASSSEILALGALR